MHFSIPYTVEESTGTNSYTGYNIYINGSYHCCLRYKQMHAFHEQLRRRCSELNIQLPAFPPKRLLPLTNGQLETRRAALEHYLQLIGQDVRVSKLDIFQNFLLNAQQETAAAESILEDFGDVTQETTQEVILMNGYQLQVNCHIGDNSGILLEKVCQSIHLPLHLVPYFCLFLMRKDAKDTVVLLRRLMDFESPFLSRLQAKPCQILLRKSYWNPIYDMNLLQDSVALNLLFIQTVSDVDREWIIAVPEIRQKLRNLQEHGFKKEYLEMARQLPLYGCLQFSAAMIDYPDPQTSALISIGNKELSMRTVRGAKIYETKFRVTRMRCWRVTAMHNSLESKDNPSSLQLSFEYLMSKQTLRWITITSAQTMLMSVCLQSMVDELLNFKDSNQLDTKSNNSTNYTNSPPPSYDSRNARISQSSYSLSNEQSSNTSTSSSTSSPTAPVKFIATQRRTKHNPKISTAHSYSAVFFRNAEESVHNEAFEGIGDDDL
ncbi:sorting nexin-17 [Teleopsis dalmanni]|uniref:sorting nexin-17 n=1 Tax=Teleopsis dalmanni TaxID=139649 RepID=UPI0018CD12E6|nr:sorting nexin-17 [Teleopsis dalmanni]